jgi:hypothetical protein
MCIAVCYLKNDKNVIVKFHTLRAALPIQSNQLKHYNTIIWGRHKSEYVLLPFGSSITIESVKSKLWHNHSPVLVKIPVTKFMVEDLNNHIEWFEVPNRQFIQGLVLQNKTQKRLYIVCVTRQIAHHIYLHWPNVVY